MASVTPLSVRFDSHVELTIHGAFLASAGLLQCDPLARVHVVTVCTRTTAATAAATPDTRGDDDDDDEGVRASAAATCVTISAREVGHTTQRLCTAHPVYKETLRFDVRGNNALTALAGSLPPSPQTAAQQTAAAAARHDTSSLRGECVEDFVVVTFESDDGRACYGQAYCPFSPHCNSAATTPVRVALQPRNVHNVNDPLHRHDVATLARLRRDHFGYVTVTWRVTVLPHGGALMRAPLASNSNNNNSSNNNSNNDDASAPSLPVGLTVKATWLAPATLRQRDVQFTTSLVLDGGGGGGGASAGASDRERFCFTPQRPLCLTIRRANAANALSRAVVYCTLHHLTAPACSRDVPVPLPLPPLTSSSSYDRDVHWLAAVRTATGEDYGMLLATTRLSRRALDAELPPCADDSHTTATTTTAATTTTTTRCAHINDPLHQEQYAHATAMPAEALRANTTAATLPPSPAPQCPAGPYQPLQWESAAHMARAAERRWRRSCVVDAQPREEHVRHLFDVLMHRCSTLDAGVAQLAAVFAGDAVYAPHRDAAHDENNNGNGNGTSAAAEPRMLRELMVACAFHARDMDVQRAARFCFCALRSDVEDAVGVDEVRFLFEHCLLEHTVDMPAAELQRYVRDLFGDVRVVTFADFTRYVVHNYAVWAAFGVPLTVDLAASSAQRPHLCYHADADVTPSSSNMYNNNNSSSNNNSSNTTVAACADATTYGSNSSKTTTVAAVTAAAAAAATTRRPVASDGDATHGHNNANNDNNDDDDAAGEWRTFVVRVARTRKAYSVTAHVRDTIADAMAMVQDSVGILAARQEWLDTDGVVLDACTRIGSTSLGLPSTTSTRSRRSSRAASPQQQQQQQSHTHASASRRRSHSNSNSSQTATTTPPPPQDVWIREQEDALLVHFRCVGRSAATQKRWQERVRASEKVLRVRAAVQRRTLIPLSRCVLRLRRGGAGSAVATTTATTVLLHDRHPLSHYKLQPDDVIEVTQE